MADITGMLQAAAGAGGAEETDPNFNQTVLLLHGDGTDGSQNNTFLDSSTNNFTITRNGNTTQGTFSPFSVADGAWSTFHDGSGDYLTSSQVVDTSDFTIEAFVYFTDPTYAKFAYIFAQGSAGTSGRLGLYIEQTTGKLVLQISSTLLKGTSQVPTNTWVHVAARRSSNATAVYVDAVSENTGTQSDAIQATTAYIGRSWNSGEDFTGYISNLRVSNNARTITLLTAPYTSDANTELLTCQSNRFVDNSSNAFALTVFGTPSVQPFSPFAPTAAYSPTTNGGSGYFDGTGDYLTLSPNAVFRPSGDFTLEAWIYIPNVSGLKNILATLDASAFYQLNLAVNNANARFILGPYSGGAYAVNIAAGTVVVNAWNHIAVARSGSGSNNIRMWLNGSSVAQATSTATPNAEASVDIGRENYAGGNVFNGYMSGLRLITGTAAYDPANSTITIPTAPLTAITNTSLLCNFTNAGIFDNTGKNNLETVGNAQIDTTTKKFGTGSMEFDGTGDYLKAASNPQFILSGDFTIEAWVYPNSTAANFVVICLGDSYTSTGLELYAGSAVLDWRVFSANASKIDSSTAYASGAWVHLAVVRSSGVVTLYVNGTAEGSTWSTTATFSGNLLVGGELYNGTLSSPTNGFIDDLRITKGVARYTTTFTPPDKAFPDQ